MRRLHCLLLLALPLAQPGVALARDAPYYGPMKAWRGIGYKIGYRDRIEKDGSWRIEAAVRGGESIDMAVYRAAEKAHEEGFAYVEMLGASGVRMPGNDQATLYARPSHSPAPPTGCRSKRKGTCYTADVAEVMRILSGPDGMQPGVAIVDHVDDYGRELFLSGFGTGMASPNARPVATLAAHPSMPAQPFTPATVRPVSDVRMPAGSPMAALSGAARTTVRSNAEILADRLKAAQPVKGRDAKQGWTISD